MLQMWRAAAGLAAVTASVLLREQRRRRLGQQRRSRKTVASGAHLPMWLVHGSAGRVGYMLAPSVG